MASQQTLSYESTPPATGAYQPLVAVAAAAACGVFADRVLAPPLSWYFIAGGLLAGLWLAAARRRPVAGLLLALLLVACAAGGWHHCRWSLFNHNDIGRFAAEKPRPCCLEGVVLRGPRVLPPPEAGPLDVIPRSARTRMDISVVKIRDRTRFRAARGTAALYVDGVADEVRPGDRIRVFGSLVKPARATNPGQFDHRDHYRAQRIGCMIRSPQPGCVEIVGRGGRFCPRRLLEALRRGATDLLDRYLCDSHAGLASALLLGARDRVDDEQQLAFQETGTVHMLAISGLHVGIVYGGVLLLCRVMFLRLNVAVLLAAGVCVLYVLLTDARPPALRAAMLFVILSLAVATSRRSIATNALAAAGIAVLVLNPADLFATGVQLSFLAVAGLIWIGRRSAGWSRPRDALERLVVETSGRFDYAVWWTRRKAWQILATSATVWILTTPLVLAEFHVVSPIGLLFNMFVSVPLAFALVGGFGVLLFGAWCAPAATAAAWVCDGALALISNTIAWGQSIPGGHFWLPGPPGWWLCGFYAALAAAALFPGLRPSPRWAIAMAVGWCGLGCLATGTHRTRPDLVCTVLSVGHGTAIVLELPTGETVLCDAGQLSSASAGTQTIADFLWSRGIMRIDAVILSHPDADHYNAVPGLLERFRIRTVCAPPRMFRNPSGTVGFLLRAFKAAEVETITVRRGDTWRIGECRFRVFHPGGRKCSENDNADCLVLGIEYARRRILLTGDLESAGVGEVVSQPAWDCDVFYVPHHGGKSGHSPKLIAWARPELAIASAGSRGVHPEVAKCYRSLGAELLSTDRSGAIRVRVGAGGVNAVSFVRDVQEPARLK